MDGVIAKWQEDKTEQDIMEPGYFATIPYVDVMNKTIELVKSKIDNVSVMILSKLIDRKPSIAQEKLTWLENHPIQFDAIYLVPESETKAEFINKFNLKGIKILVDDLNKNLEDWDKAGYIPIKFVNHINSPSKKYINIYDTMNSNIYNDDYFTDKQVLFNFDLIERVIHNERNNN